MNKSYQNWLDYMNSQLAFYKKGFRKNRVDKDFDWIWLDSRKDWKDKISPMVKSLVSIVRPRAVESEYQWLNENSELLYGARQILKDELSKHLFDCNLLITIMGYERFYYPRIDFDDLVSVQREEDFISDLPHNYLGMPLKIYIIRVSSCTLKILTYKTYIELLNRYRQYFLDVGN